MGADNENEPAPDKPAKTNLIALRDQRERAIELITERFSEDIIDDDEMERRLELAQNATTLEELADLTDDLRAPEDDTNTGHQRSGPSTALVTTDEEAPVALIPADAVPAENSSTNILGDSKREGSWVPARHTKSLTVLGDTTLDFREALMGPGEINVNVRCVLGDVKVIIPPGLPVELECSSVLADVKRAPTMSDPTALTTGSDAPRVRLTGYVVLGNLHIEERLPGESRREAKKRLKEQKKQLKAKQKRKLLGDGS